MEMLDGDDVDANALLMPSTVVDLPQFRRRESHRDLISTRRRPA